MAAKVIWKFDLAQQKNTNRLLFLDGLRGVAALSVVAFHLAPKIISHGFLAVDFFFLMSGYVVSQAYSTRLQNGMKFTRFMAIRIVRLWPMIIFGGVFGGLSILFVNNWRSIRVIEDVVAAIFLIPVDFENGQMHLVFWPINGPSWSMFYEILASGFFSLIIWRLNRFQLFSLACLGAAALVGNVIIFKSLGPGTDLMNSWGNVSRILFSFSMGTFLCRIKIEDAMRKLRFNKFIILAALLFSFSLPFNTQGFTDFITVAIMYPLILAVAVGESSQDTSEWLQKLCTWGGNISYPIYMISSPIMLILHHFENPITQIQKLECDILTVITIVVAAIGLERFYDQPLRAYLGRKLLRPAI